MSGKEVDLDFRFDNEELANFLENFSEKVREGKVGLSFRGKEEVEIEPTEDAELDMDFFQEDDHRRLELNITLKEEVETTEQGRQRISVEVIK
ncbi:MAG: amphi-Trp domain-containing protein [Candidatus Nanohalobium sp.]